MRTSPRCEKEKDQWKGKWRGRAHAWSSRDPLLGLRIACRPFWLLVLALPRPKAETVRVDAVDSVEQHSTRARRGVRESSMLEGEMEMEMEMEKEKDGEGRARVWLSGVTPVDPWQLRRPPWSSGATRCGRHDVDFGDTEGQHVDDGLTSAARSPFGALCPGLRDHVGTR